MSDLGTKIILLSFCIALSVVNIVEGKDLITEISPVNSTVSVYDPFIVEVKARASFKDPYDP